MKRTDQPTVAVRRGKAEGGGEGSERVDELALLRRVAEQDREAFERFYHLYYPRLFSYLFRVIRRVELVEETLNDVMMVVWEGAGNFREKSRVSTWIFGIAYRQAMKALRRTGRQPSLVSPEGLEEESLGVEDRQLRGRVLRLAMSDALEQLTPEHRAVVELTYYYGCTYREIAEIVGCPENTVKTRMFYARRRLRGLLGEERENDTEGESR